MNEAKQCIIKDWPEASERVLQACATATPFNDTAKKFLENCTACGGNWGHMLLTGINELWPDVYDAIPDDMGLYAFNDICAVLKLCGVNMEE